MGYAPGHGIFLEYGVFLEMLVQDPQVVPTGRGRFRVDARDTSEIDQDRFLSSRRADGFAVSGHLGQLFLGLLDLVLARLHELFACLYEHVKVLLLELSFFDLYDKSDRISVEFAIRVGHGG